MISYLLLILGFALLIKGADFLVEGARLLARRFKVSDLVVGLTVVAFGTSTPELFVNIFASFQHNSDIAIGNILGSNTFNTFFILGVSAVVFPLAVTKGTVWNEIPFSFLAALFVGILANDQMIDGTGVSALTRTDGLVFIAFFAIFLYYAAGIARDIMPAPEAQAHVPRSLLQICFMILGGLMGLVLGGKWVVDGAVILALRLGVSQSLVALTVVAAGTSLPELATSVVAAFKRNSDIAIGNVVGSNIFNIFFILGISAVMNPLPVNPRTNIDIGMTMLSSLLLFVCMFMGKRHRLDRWQGFLFIVLYIGYVAFLVRRG